MTIEQLRRYRLGEYAIFDLVLAFVAIYLLSPILSKLFRYLGLEIPRQSWLFLTLPISILIHLVFSSQTKMTINFMDPQGHYLLKIFIFGLTLLGLLGIKSV